MTTHVDEDVWEAPPPSDVPAEASVLGACMLSAAAMGEVATVLEAVDFYRPAHQVLFQACLDLYEAGRPVDPTTVGAALGPRLVAMGGGSWLHTLIAEVPSATHAGYYAAIVAERALARRLVEAGIRIQQIGRGLADADDMIPAAEHALTAAARPTRVDNARPMSEVLDEVLEELDTKRTITGLQTGYLDLDLILNPLEPGQLLILGARPSIGKSTMAIDILRHVVLRLQQPALMLTQEMSTVEVVRKILSAETEVGFERVQRHELTDDDWDRVARNRDRLLADLLMIDDTPSQTLGSIRAAIRRHTPALVVLDYLQLSAMPRKEDRRESIEEFTRGLKLIAKTEHVPLLVLSQLNRQAESRHDKRPAMADLRESGSIEQDADVVMLLHRPSFYDMDDSPGEAEVIVAKQRNGPTGTIHLADRLHLSKFADLSNQGWSR